MPSKKMRVIGITGGVGSGKSRVLQYLQEHWKAFVIQADLVGHQVMEPGGPCYGAVLSLFGDSVRGEEGYLDRKKISEIVFQNPEMKKRLEAIIHPAVKEEILVKLRNEERTGRELSVVEAALLLEDHYEAFCDEIWYVYAPEEIRIERLMESRGYSREKALGIMKNQGSDEFFRSRADTVIENSGDWESTRARIDEEVETPCGF